VARPRGKRGCVDHYRLGKGAVTVLTEDAESDTEAVLSGQAVVAATTRQSGVEDHLGTLFDAFHSFTNIVNDAGTVGTTDVRKTDRNAWHAVEDEKIEMIECGALQPHPDLPHSRFGLRAITEEKSVGSAVPFKVQSFHTNLP
jgi:hypothetical protein